MELIEIRGESEELTRQQRWSHALALVVAVLVLLYGLNLRTNALSATTLYTDVEAGLRVRYPQNWLIDRAGDYVFRVRDMTRIGYKTTIQVETIPIGLETTERLVFYSLNINRPLTLSTYSAETDTAYILPDESTGRAMQYTFVDTEGAPVVVRGLDILTIRGGQAILIIFRADAQTFQEDLAVFNRFLDNLEFQ